MSIIIDLIKKYGIKKILEVIADELYKSNQSKDRKLAEAIWQALREYDRG